MHELNIAECEIAGGGVIRVDGDGEVTNAFQGEMTINRDGSMTMTTTDGWSYFRNADHTWSLWNGEQLVISGVYKLNLE